MNYQAEARAERHQDEVKMPHPLAVANNIKEQKLDTLNQIVEMFLGEDSGCKSESNE